ncbi:class II histone deacetylase [Aquibium sp. LZ166]|uniref:Class II histone deacetylase n=1 Tax=Aquibium pacificus TaxID=3153579 RepID=A0ABV3SPV1_9HYPH
MTASTAFYWNEHCFWHSGGNYAFILPVQGNVQPVVNGGLPETPESKRRFLNLLLRTGLADELAMVTGRTATEEELRRVHPADYLAKFKALSDASGGELGVRTPFSQGGYEMTALSAGMATQALRDVLKGTYRNAYALCRPPGHHCLPSEPMGYCLLANVAIAIETALAEKTASRIAVVDWDVHHGNGTEHIFYERSDVLTISLHQENNYPANSGAAESRGARAGEGYNINVPLLPGSGHDAYIHAMERIVLPALERFKPDAIVVACGFDASGVDPLSRMIATSDTFRRMTAMVLDAAEELCGGKAVFAHEGGYSEVHVPFCGHAVVQTLAGSSIDAGDPLLSRLTHQQPNEGFRRYQRKLIDDMGGFFGL